MKKRTIGLTAITMTTVLLATFGYTSYSKSTIPYVAENTYQMVDSQGNINLYPDTKTLYEKADLVAEVKIQSQETLQISDASVETRSKAQITDFLKGDISAGKIAITEYGGIRDLSSMTGNENRYDPKNPPQEKSGFVELTLEGSTVMKPNQKYIVFLYKVNSIRPGTPDDGLQNYTPVGVVQGKIKVDDKDMLVSTVSPKHVEEDKEVYHLLHNFAGKDKKTLTAELKKFGK